MIENWADFVRFSDGTCLRWVATLLHFLWQGAVIGILVLISETVLRGRSAASRYMLNAAALLCMPICVALTFLSIGGSVSSRSTSLVPPGVTVEDHATSLPKGAFDEVSLAAEPTVTHGNLGATPTHHSAVFEMQSSRTWFQYATGVLAKMARPISAVYFLGACFFLLRLGTGLWGGHRLRSTAREVSDPTMLRIIADQARQVGLKFVPVVGYCERVAVPTVVGLMRPMVLFPSLLVGLDSGYLAAVISHEFAHIRRHDLLMNLVQRVVESLLFFHPATWYVSRRMSTERELCCDDLVLATGKERLRYAQALLKVADLSLGVKPAGVTALAAAGNDPSEFEQRIQRLMDARPKSRLQLTRSGLSIMLFWLALTIAAPGLFRTWVIAEDDVTSNAVDTVETIAQATERIRNSEPARSQPKTSNDAGEAIKEAVPSPAHRVSVLCVDAEGNPVEGAEVHLFQYLGKERGARYLHFGPLKSDVEGKVLFSRALFSNSHGNFDRWVYARVPGKLVGAGRSARWISRRSIINPDARVKMMPSRSVEGTVTVPVGLDPKNVNVSVRTMHITTGDGDFEYQSFPREIHFRGLDTSLPGIFECRPDLEGRIRFDDVPVRGRLYLVTFGQGLGEAQWRNDGNSRSFDEPIDITIEKERRLFGRVLSPTGEPAAGVEVSARISSSNVSYLSTFRFVTNEAGDFEISGLPALDFRVSVSDPHERWVFRPLERVRGSAKTGPELTLKMEIGIFVSGKVVDPEGNVVEGAALSALADTQEGPGLDHDTTDHNGRYRLRIPAGQAKFYFNALPDGFKYPRPQIIKRLDIQAGQAAVKDLIFTLDRKTDVDD
jgi:beta-lactamase regulating signal transducer with metallopeptidase domain